MKSLTIGRGFELSSDMRKAKSIKIAYSSRTSHMWTFGTTRVGKTKLLESILEQDIPAGNSVVVIDPKGDGELFSKIVQLVKSSNREADLMLFTPIFPEYSVHFNPLNRFYMLEELVGHIISGIADGKEPFFANVAYEVSLALVMVDNLKRNRKTVDCNGINAASLADILADMSHSHIEKLYEEMLDIDTEESLHLAETLLKIKESGQDYYNKVSSSLRVALMEVCNGNIGSVVGKTNDNPFIDRLESGKSVIFVVQLGALLTRKPAYTVGKIILSSIQSLVGRMQASDKRFEKPLTIHIDEAQSVLYKGIDELFAKGGSANVFIHGYCQSISQMYSIIGKDYSHAILDNCNTKIFMRVTDSLTAKYISEHFGVKQVFSSIMNGSGNVTFRDGEDDLVKPTDVMGLSPRLFYMLTYSGRFYGKTLDVIKPTLKVIFPEVKSSIVSGGGLSEVSVNSDTSDSDSVFFEFVAPIEEAYREHNFGELKQDVVEEVKNVLLKRISEKVNVADDKGIYKIFSIKDKVYVHTSGLSEALLELGLTKENVKLEMAELGTFESFYVESDDKGGYRSKFMELSIDSFDSSEDFELRKDSSFKVKSIKRGSDEGRK